MEKYVEVLVFLAFAAFSLLSQFLNRKKKAVTRAPEQDTQRDFRQPRADDPPVTARPPRPQPSTTNREPTLRDILREMTGQTEPEEEYEDDYELPPYLQEKKEEIGAPPPPQLVDPVPKKLADKVSLEDDGKRIKPLRHDDVRRVKKSWGASIGRSLRNPENAKKAIILSEILQRKYQ
ncbi:MAG: hypothetical protein WA960_01290 [Tunicatimonas sp.]